MKKPEALSEKQNHIGKIREKVEAKLTNMTPSREMVGIKIDDLIHELQVHQIELEMQNEELKRAQIAQDEIKDRYIDLYDLAPVGYFTFSRVGLIKEVNLRGADLLGIPRTKLINRGFGNFIVPSDFDIWNEHFLKSLLKDGRKQSCELWLKSRDSSTIFVRLDSVRLEKLGIVQVHTAVSDITERKKLEKHLLFINKAVESINVAIGISDAQGHHFYQNKALSDLFEYATAQDLEAAGGESILVKDPEVAKEMFSNIMSGKSWSGELNMVTKSGHVFSAYEYADAIKDKKGNIIGLIGIINDLTERKKAQEERIQLLGREHKAYAEAEAARNLAHMKSMFISATSHELRTPLNSIIGFTSLTLDGTFGELKPDQKKYLNLVHSSGKHLLSLINDILDLSMVESGKIRAVVSDFNLRQIVDEAATTLQVILIETKIELKINMSDIKIKSDRMRLLQCLINLIGNAIKFTEKGSVEITAKVIGKNIEISVIDTGIGIKKEDIPKLFDPFVRLQTPLTAKTSGTGLGLYLVKIIAEDVLGGDVDVESEFGVGSKFTLNIPIELEGKV